MDQPLAVPELDAASPPASPAARAGVASVAGRVLLWFAGNVVLAVVVAWIAVGLQRQFNPVLVFALLAGIVLGAGGAWIARRCRLLSRKLIVPGAIFFGLLAVVGQEYFGYLQYQRDLDESTARDMQRARDVVLARAAFSVLDGTFTEFVERRRAANPWWLCAWALDALLTATITAVVSAAGLRRKQNSQQQPSP
jgi:hypothetical protein